VGFVDWKARTVYVTRALPAPPDSVGDPTRFVRGVEEVPEGLSRIAERTGGILHFVGDWHSHPGGGTGLSTTDLKTAGELRRDLRGVPVPTHLLVATDGGLHSYIFPE
jgi:proteasome lid subunit RPN8/RPN11